MAKPNKKVVLTRSTPKFNSWVRDIIQENWRREGGSKPVGAERFLDVIPDFPESKIIKDKLIKSKRKENEK